MFFIPHFFHPSAWVPLQRRGDSFSIIFRTLLASAPEMYSAALCNRKHVHEMLGHYELAIVKILNFMYVQVYLFQYTSVLSDALYYLVC